MIKRCISRGFNNGTDTRVPQNVFLVTDKKNCMHVNLLNLKCRDRQHYAKHIFKHVFFYFLCLKEKGKGSWICIAPHCA